MTLTGLAYTPKKLPYRSALQFTDQALRYEADNRHRTCNLDVGSVALCLLSYVRVCPHVFLRGDGFAIADC